MAAALCLTGCWDTSETKAANRDKIPDPPAITTSQPQIVTDLTQISVAKTVALPGAEAPPHPTLSADKTKPAANEAETHKVAVDAPKTRYTQEADPGYQGGTKLMNDKARQFANFSDLILE